jgi:hypothetical protein
MESLDEYERLLAPVRESFAVSPGVQAINSSLNDVFLESFLLRFCALGSQMTEPVEGWIRRAAGRCAAMGHAELEHALNGHAQAEAGHHLMMIADVTSLAARWNARRKPLVDARKLLNQAPTPGMLQYCKVHEENIAGDTPTPRSLSSMRWKCFLFGMVSYYLPVVSKCSELRFCLVSVSSLSTSIWM